MEHPAPASKAIFESGWVKLFSIGIKEKALLTHGEQSRTFSTLSHSFLSQSSYSRAWRQERGEFPHGVIVTRLFFFPCSFPNSSSVSTPADSAQLGSVAVLVASWWLSWYRGSPPPATPLPPPRRPFAVPDRPLCQVPCLPLNWRHCALYLSKRRGERRGRTSGVCQRGLHTRLLCPGDFLNTTHLCLCYASHTRPSRVNITAN